MGWNGSRLPEAGGQERQGQTGQVISETSKKGYLNLKEQRGKTRCELVRIDGICQKL